MLLVYCIFPIGGWFLINFIYVTVQAIVGVWVGATVEEVSVGIGPLLWKGKYKGAALTLRGIPLSGFTRFYGTFENEDDGETLNLVTPNEFEDAQEFTSLPASRRILVYLTGPFSVLLFGLVLLSLPVLLGSPQLVVAPDADMPVAPTGVPNLGLQDSPTTWNGQLDVFNDTFVEFFRRLIRLESMQGWGYVISQVITMAAAMRLDAMSGLTCLGVVSLGMALINLAPLPPMNGWVICTAICESCPVRISTRLYDGFVIAIVLLELFAVYVCGFYLDYRWCTETFWTAQ
ncbi:MAG: site-2 protease family protein [Planctomycetaceae bacterium]|nr:site-2 protease family protein [Planctomycetaceae bacterium]MCA9045939.1 site-2 protease family protein [Planctomycetaceae bacterium]MCB9949727.1 site-2 protease family protein [Planctomycetaceae bacterium]